LDVRSVSASFSPQGDSLPEIIRTLLSARKRVDVAPFYLSHTNLVDTLCFLAANQKIKVRCFMDPASTAPAEAHVLDRLAQSGAEVLIVHVPNGKMHLKCAVVDDDLVITGAANWTVRGFDHNVEDSIFLQSAALAQAYRARLDRLTPMAERHHPPSDGLPASAPPKRMAVPSAKPPTVPVAAPRDAAVEIHPHRARVFLHRYRPR
jgi:phosphatidylserine/phosphatidylglycerophosphate/cardiolipin synthase-like enzyme